jgi:hypothetical protein
VPQVDRAAGERGAAARHLDQPEPDRERHALGHAAGAADAGTDVRADDAGELQRVGAVRAIARVRAGRLGRDGRAGTPGGAGVGAGAGIGAGIGARARGAAIGARRVVAGEAAEERERQPGAAQDTQEMPPADAAASQQLAQIRGQALVVRIVVVVVVPHGCASVFSFSI